MAINVYLNFNGNCREAVEFYAEVFEAEQPLIMTYGQAPPDPNFALPDEAKNLVLHAKLNITGSTVMFSDNFPGSDYVVGTNVSLSITSKDIDEIKSLFDKMKVGGNVFMELHETFWSKCYGNLTDKFGIEWQFSYDNGEMGM